MNAQRSTIYSIAKTLGVSPSTVSRSFTRPELVKDSVRRAVLATARDVGYAPNRAARGLATGRTGLLGLLVPDVENPFFPPLVRSVQEAARRRDTEVLLVDSELRTEAEEDFISRIRPQVDGLIIASPRLPTARLRERVGALPTVVVNRTVRSFSTVVCDTSGALRELADHLHDIGHRRFALVRGPRAAWAAEHRARAIKQWADDTGADLTELGPREAQFDGGYGIAAQIVESDATAVFAFDDLVAAGVIAGLADAGERVPEHRSIVGCDDVLLARTMTPGLATVSAPFGEIGEQAVQLLGEALDGAEPRSVSLPGQAVIRGSVGPLPDGV